MYKSIKDFTLEFKNPITLLILILIIGIFFRLFNIWDNFTFGYDQGRDAQRISDIMTFKNLKLVGQESDIPGVFHGALTYYLLAPIHFLSNSNPNYSAIFLSIINLSGVVLLYYSSVVLFKNRGIGLVAGFFWAVSYEQISFARFISNASAMGIASIIFFLGIAIYLFQKKQWGLTLSIVGLVLCVQFNFYLIYLILFYPIFYFIYKPKINKRIIIPNFVIMLVLLSFYLFVELRWNFMMSKALISYFLHNRGSFDLIENTSRYASRVFEAVYYSFLALDSAVLFPLFIIFSIIGWRLMKNTKLIVFFYLWLFSTVPLFFFSSGVLETQLINTTLFAPLTLLIAYCITQLYIKKRANLLLFICVLLIVMFSNINLLYKDNFKSIRLLSKQNFILADEKKLIDYTYQSSKEKEFSVCALTNPLFVNTLWSYLYNWYGKDKYGYIPYWAGQEQTNADNKLPYDKKHVSERYLIIEPPVGMPDFVKKVFIYMEDNTSTLQDEKKFGDLIVQKRKLHTDLSEFTNSQNLTSQEIKSIKSKIKIDPRYTCYTTYTNDI